MNRQRPIPLLALALCAAWGSTHATEKAVHNDMDGDGRSDLVWRNASNGTIVYWPAADYSHLRVITTPADVDPRRLTPVFTFSNSWTIEHPEALLLLRDSVTGLQYEVGRYWHSDYIGSEQPVAVGDFNGNGYADELIRNAATGENSLVFEFDWRSPSGWYDEFVTYGTAPTVALAWIIAGIGDFDGDTYSDVLWRDTVTGNNTVWRSADAATRQPLGRVTNLAWRIAAVGDFNGDHKSDIFWRNTSTGANVIWYAGKASTSRAARAVTSQNWQVTATGDFDGDGRWDLFWRNGATGANVIWKSANSATRLAVRGVSNLAWSTVK